jgi:GTP-binding protein EngB required for normal cell division
MLLFVSPYILVFGLGTYWTWEHGLVWIWAVGTGVPTFLGLALMERARRMIFPDAAPLSNLAPTSTPAGQAAMRSVRAISERVQTENPPLEKPEVLEKVVRETFLEVLETVARHYHPQADRPSLETPVAHVAALIELVVDDFRRTFMRSVPWGKTVTLGRLLWWKQKGDWSWRSLMYVWQMNRIRRMCLRPATALVQEVQDHLGQNMTAKSLDGLKRSAIDFCITKAGEYAIQLYSGGFLLESERRPRLSEPVDNPAFANEPFQTLVVGQVKSGKSSLINALQGAVLAPVDVLPTTDAVDLYPCQPAGLPPLILRDTPGYAAAGDKTDPFARLQKEIDECDLLVVVCSARSAARKADRDLLEKIHEHYRNQPKRMPPPVLYVLTHIDTLPEDLIDEAKKAVADDFGVFPGRIVPICGRWGQLSNLEGVYLEMQTLLPEAERLKTSRCVRQIRREQDEDQIVHQLLAGLRLAGGWIANR